MVGIARVQSHRPNVITGFGGGFAVSEASAVGRDGPWNYAVLSREDLLWFSGAVAAHPADPETAGVRLEGHVLPVGGPDWYRRVPREGESGHRLPPQVIDINVGAAAGVHRQ